MRSSPGEITRLLERFQDGDREAEARLLEAVYGELRKMAAYYMSREHAGHTLSPTALVHETYLRLLQKRRIEMKNRSHFFGIASKAMRMVLVDHARRGRARKRGGGAPKASLQDEAAFTKAVSEEILAVDEALDRLSAFDARQARIIEMKYFAGMSAAEIADLVHIGVRSVERELELARAWLQTQLERSYAKRAGAVAPR
jgi:RNA polymerase sigma factor (TIGR02999 family)